ncbi:unnamed protein product [Arctogadus glacialis]
MEQVVFGPTRGHGESVLSPASADGAIGLVLGVTSSEPIICQAHPFPPPTTPRPGCGGNGPVELDGQPQQGEPFMVITYKMLRRTVQKLEDGCNRTVELNKG